MNLRGNKQAPKHTQRFLHAKAGSPTRRETHGDGTPIRPGRKATMPAPGKGQPMKMGQSVVLIPRRREGIRKLLKAEVCEMQTTDVLLVLLRALGKRGLPVTRIYRQLFNPHLYLTAYGP